MRTIGGLPGYFVPAQGGFKSRALHLCFAFFIFGCRCCAARYGPAVRTRADFEHVMEGCEHVFHHSIIIGAILQELVEAG